jgi:hypothetical protein
VLEPQRILVHSVCAKHLPGARPAVWTDSGPGVRADDDLHLTQAWLSLGRLSLPGWMAPGGTKAT